MEANNSARAASSEPHRTVALPYAWYVSGDLIFELYEGGQHQRTYSIHWEHLKPITKFTAPPITASQ